MSRLLRHAFARFAPAGARGRLTVLIFHRVLGAPDYLRPGEPTADQFEQRLRWLKEHFNILRLEDAVDRLRDNGLPERAMAITFDDGYADNHDLAAPILSKLGLTATFFVATGYLDGGVMFNDVVIDALRRAPGPGLDLTPLGLGAHDVSTPEKKFIAWYAILDAIRYAKPSVRSSLASQVASACGVGEPLPSPMMSGAQVRGLVDLGMDVGAHTVNHPILTELDLPAARWEIQEGRTHLESLIGRPVRLFAYPNGQPGRDYDSEHVRLVEDLGFKAALTTAKGVASRGCDLFQLPRFTPWHWRPARASLQLAGNFASTLHTVPVRGNSPATMTALEGARVGPTSNP